MSSRRINTFASTNSSLEFNKDINIVDHSKMAELLKDFQKNEKYEHLTVVGQGGMGKVTLSRDKNTLRKVAIKTLKEDLLENPKAVIRFTEEAQITAQIEHPNVIPVYEMGIDKNDAPFYTMKYVKGTNLKEILKLIKNNNEIIMRKFHIIELLNIFVKVCDAVAFASSKGVLHRDLKPENIMIGEFGEVLIVDWGLAKTFKKKASNKDQTAFDGKKLINNIDAFIEKNIDTIRSINDVNLSLDNCLIGTPQYMAPERIVGKDSEQSEVFALGSILHDILTLAHMFTATEAKEILQKIALGDFKDMKTYKSLPHLPKGKVPSPLIAVVEKATQTDPVKRYENIIELKHEIEAYILGYATKAERAGFFRLLKLGLIRHKKISSIALFLITALIFVSAVFIYELAHSRQDALNKSNYASSLEKAANKQRFQVSQKSLELENKINELKSHTHIIVGNALHESDKLNFKRALNYINYAIELAPEKDNYYLHKGRILLTLLSFDEASDAFKKVSENSKHFSRTQGFLEKSEILLSKDKNGTLNEQDIADLFKYFKSVGEYSEAIALLKRLKNHDNYDEFLTEIWIAKLKRSHLEEAINKNSTIIKANRGKFTVVFNNSPVYDLWPLEKMPIREIHLSNVRVNNIDALKGMPLEIVSLNNTGIRSLEPLKGAPLKQLRIKDNQISDLTPLTGMQLTQLHINNCPVSELSAVRGMNLQRLTIEHTLISSLSPLAGMSLKYLKANNTRIKSIKTLARMPLKTLMLNSSPVNSIRALKSIAVTHLDLSDTLITGLPAVNLKNLEVLKLNNTPIKSIKSLSGAKKLKEIELSQTQITNLTPLIDAPLRLVNIEDTAIAEISPIANKALEELYISGSYISSLSALSKCNRLQALYANNCEIYDLEPLKNLPLTRADLSGNKDIKSISALKNANLEELNISRTSVSDINFLKNDPIIKLDLSSTRVKDFSAIATMQELKELITLDCKRVTSVAPLMEAKKLQIFKFTPDDIKDVLILEKHPSLKFLGFEGANRPVGTFWKNYKDKFGNNVN